jgi:hypothetical protein
VVLAKQFNMSKFDDARFDGSRSPVGYIQAGHVADA